MLRAKPPPPSAQDLELDLRTFYRNGRALFLDFGHTYLKISFLVHSSVQFYPRSVWETSIMAVNSKDRGFKIGLAIEFDNFFFAVLTNDLVIQPEWVTGVRQSLPLRERLNLGPDVLDDYEHFLQCVANWIELRRTGQAKRNGLACRAVRNASEVWVGVGVYTVAEIFFIAGLSPFLVEHEVFDSPSRTARLCEAFWQFAYDARDIFTKYIQRTLVGHLIAPTNEHRLRYQYDLYVHGKTSTRVTPRHDQLISEYKVLGQKRGYWTRVKGDVYDPFEPQYMLEALLQVDQSGAPFDKPKPLSLGSLIFGAQAWRKIVEDRHGMVLDDADSDMEEDDVNDPLSAMFYEACLLNAPTFLQESCYSTLHDTSDLNPHQRPVSITYFYKPEKSKQSRGIWTVLPAFPPRSRPIPTKRFSQVPVNMFKKHSLTFQHIVTCTNKVSIGPLEYCGHGKRIVIRGSHNPVKYR
ncbi:hypothetical protein BKA70DRAFT_1121340 [Coprinopsis sp. MPI-PUGE-AT-0042]|nr:hypothetical protein BKA70DRAFT_1121340 [Coprinopsis sp. MPI-PUGE-AT-0042]